jgi:hypothetical protein
MDRRDFFRTMIAAPLLTPFLLDLKPSTDDELFLISDKPQTILPVLLEELGKWKGISGQTLAFSNQHPEKKALIHLFEKNGWVHVLPSSQADLSLSFHPLQHPTPASFVLVSSGKILDIRSHRLRSLWQEINANRPLSSCLTAVSLRTGSQTLADGKTVRIYKDGWKAEELSLKKDRVKSFQARQGPITVRIQGEKVWIPESSCRHKICCLTPPISFGGERIVCAPNHFLVEIRGPGKVDTVIG